MRKTIKILFVHNYYQQAGGEDAVVNAEISLMRGKGHKIELFQVNNDDVFGFIAKIKVALNLSYSEKSKQILKKKLIEFQPDIVHVHNFFPILSPSIYDACIEEKVSVVQTLHNYRTMCPGALLLRDGKNCELCVKNSAYQSVIYRCYKNSFVGTLSVARMIENHRSLGTWNIKVNRFIALTDFARSKFIEAGFPEDKIRIKSNFSVDLQPYHSDSLPQRKGALFVGRLSQEKGVNTLVNAWKSLNIPLRIVGSGPLEHVVARLSNDGIKTLGMLELDSVLTEMKQAAFLVMPSECYEGFPMVLAEAFSKGLPVVASRLGGMAEIVEDGITGLHFEAGNAKDLAKKVQWMHDHPEECQKMGLNARKVFEEKYTAEKNYELLMGVYQEAIDDAEAKKNVV